jgi:hypothetical protein
MVGHPPRPASSSGQRASQLSERDIIGRELSLRERWNYGVEIANFDISTVKREEFPNTEESVP